MFSIFEKACFRNDALNGPHRTKINLMVCLYHHMQFFYSIFFSLGSFKPSSQKHAYIIFTPLNPNFI